MQELAFKKGDVVVLPTYLHRAGLRHGKIASDETVQHSGSTFYAVTLAPSAPRYRSRPRPQTDNTVLVNVEDLRLDVRHPSCPSCKCVIKNEEEEVEVTDDEDEEDEDDL